MSCGYQHKLAMLSHHLGWHTDLIRTTLPTLPIHAVFAVFCHGSRWPASRPILMPDSTKSSTLPKSRNKGKRPRWRQWLYRQNERRLTLGISEPCPVSTSSTSPRASSNSIHTTSQSAPHSRETSTTLLTYFPTMGGSAAMMSLDR